MYIDPKQLNLLNKVAKGPEIRLDRFQSEDIFYLQENGLVVCNQYDCPGEYFLQARITEKGKAFLYETKHSRRRTNIALILSIVAIVISLLTAFTPFADLSKSFISSLFRAFSG